MPRKKTTPSYRLHRQSGQAVVTLTDPLGVRKDYLLGQYDTPESRAAYVRLVSEWEAGGRRLPGAGPSEEDISVNELLAQYAVFAATYYLRDGKPTTHLERVKRSLREVKELYGFEAACQFGPLRLKAVRERMIAAGWTRSYVNSCIGCVKRCFRWGVENELIAAPVYQALQCVAGLKKGRSSAREGKKTQPVSDATVDATLSYLLAPVQAMVKLQRLTGMRPGEVVQMRPCDVDRGKSTVWAYRPATHKNDHHGVERVVVLGPQAQAIISPYLLRNPGAYCFSPIEATEQRSRELRARRKSPVQPSQQNRRAASRQRAPRDKYSTESYCRAIARAVKRANRLRACKPCKSLRAEDRCESCKAGALASWHPHQLRHTAATEVRKRFGLDGAQIMLGHAGANVTEIYAATDLSVAERIAREIG